MKKLMIQIAALFLGAMIVVPAFAVMDNVTYTFNGIGGLTVSTGSATYVARGQIESVFVDVTALTTGTVTLTSSAGTILTKSAIVCDTNFLPRAEIGTTAGGRITWTGTGANLDGATSNNVPGPIYDKIAVAGDLTCTFVGSAYAITTNNVVIKVIINK